MIYPRRLKTRIVRELNSLQNIIVTGMRRVGKTYLLRDVFDGITSPNKTFFDFEDRKQRAVFELESYERILHALKNRYGLKVAARELGGTTGGASRAWVFLDEVQFVRNAPSVIKYLSDHYDIQFIVSGSSSYYLKNLFSESLAGRKTVLHLSPLDFSEYLLFQGETQFGGIPTLRELSLYNEKYQRVHFQPVFDLYLNTGGFPQVALEGNPQKRQELLSDILASYYSIDVRTLSGIRHTDQLEKVVLLLPTRIGQKLDTSRVSREIGITWNTTRDYLVFLKDTFVISLLTPFSKSPDREVSVAPKLYFCDHALGESLVSISEGQRLENAVYTNLAPRYKLRYYRKKSGQEIDFILDGKIAVEVKSFATPSDVRRLARIGASLGISETYVITGRYGQEPLPGILPAYLLGFLA